MKSVQAQKKCNEVQKKCFPMCVDRHVFSIGDTRLWNSCTFNDLCVRRAFIYRSQGPWISCAIVKSLACEPRQFDKICS